MFQDPSISDARRLLRSLRAASAVTMLTSMSRLQSPLAAAATRATCERDDARCDADTATARGGVVTFASSSSTLTP